MRRALAIIFLLSASLFAQGAAGGDVFSHPLEKSDAAFIRLEASFAQLPLVASYTQTRTISRLGKSLASSGRMIVKPGAGIAWVTEEPRESVMVVGLDSVRQRAGTRAAATDVSGNQTYLAIARALDGLFSGDFAAIERAFSVYFNSEGGSWAMGLVPKDEAARAFMSSITISGGAAGGIEELGSLLIREAGGDSILYEFSNVAIRELADDEEAYFSI